MRRTAAAIGAVAVAALMVAGCSSSGSSDASKDESTTTVAPAMTTAELQSVLLAPSDLGVDWTADTSSSSGSSSTPSCLKGLTGSESESGASAEAQFKQGETVFAYEGLGAPGSESDAQAAYEKLTTALDGCNDLTFTSDGETVPATISATGSAGVGDQSAGYTMGFTTSGVSVAIDLVVAQVGSVDVIVMFGSIGDPQPGAVDQLATQAIEKITSGSQA